MIRDDGWLKYNIWEHSTTVKTLYARRCRLEEDEMTCAAQAAELLAPFVLPDDELLDAGCGSGYFFHSLRKRNIPVQYYGIDAAPSLIEIGRSYMSEYGLPTSRLRVMRIEDLNGKMDHIICMNVLSNIDNYHRPLERLLQCAQKTLILRESMREQSVYTYVKDQYLDDGCNLKVYVNTYSISEVLAFIQSYGFSAQIVEDRRTRGNPELVIDYPHYWAFLVARRIHK